ncbi:ABC transporter ATP-binding protein [Corynebacterium guangdongense]|uniref:Peptide/nickel transport system ATP-binding protein n=1 Tax=Corynebacterium guangdongense TaxID=1783348 RepID=A0ABU1ZZD3_9CORY|nr:ATP-binding cassette domain-containing protein [Corynebacterium guangdongense]MDR7330284.1 peptide/nickel transport system ATP-binding protein [Corynebacterium guangdongense]WJZ18842.1 putative D,D-dipeptide transport ATP-binding protein DdpF [Corynebacterium guangdongense]
MSLTGENLSFSYGRTPLIRDYSITLTEGRILGVHGYSGTGKSTLARLLTGYLTPSEGRVLVDGAPVVRGAFHPAQLIQQHPERAVDPRWRLSRVVENIDPDTLEQLGIRPEWLTRRALEVSGGQLQRISIARALDPRTRYLVADEITTMMDGLLQADIWAKLVAAVRERDLGMLVVSHDRDLMRHVCDEVIEFDGGAGTRR